MERRPYYSRRRREERGEVKLTLPELKRLFLDLYHDLQREDYFQEAMGYKCVDSGLNSGTMGSDIALFFRRSLQKENLYPIEDNIDKYTEEDLFTVIEFLYDHVSKGKEGRWHPYNNCGMHYDTFDRETGKDHFRTQINELISDFKTGYELSREGQILESGIEQTSDSSPAPAGDSKAESGEAELAEGRKLHARQESEPKPKATAATEAGRSGAGSPTPRQDEPALPQPADLTDGENRAGTDQRAAVDAFIEEVLQETGKRITRTDIWRAAGYKDRTEFERFQRNDPRTTDSAKAAFYRTLKIEPKAFIELRDKNNTRK